MPQFINIHCHLLNFKFIPDSFFKTRAPLREWMLRRKFTRWLAQIITALWPGKKYNRLHQALAIMNKDINDVAKVLNQEMDESNFILSTPLMMDLEIASFNEKPEIPYRYQVKLISDVAVKYPGKIMPFIMFDPRRRGVSELIKIALKEMGFLGVKMYPPLGYHPDPASFYNDAETNKALSEIYLYCEENSIPITTHCSPGGAYSSDLMSCRELIQEFCQPASWESVLMKYPKLYLNFGHFGGDFLEIKKTTSWSNKILKLIKDYANVYTDLSYHDEALLADTSEDYFEILNKLINETPTNNKILFGTDWSMTRHTWIEKEYIQPFVKKIPLPLLQKIALQNPLNFLFPDRKLPQRIKDFFRSKKITASNFPQWVKDNLLSVDCE